MADRQLSQDSINIVDYRPEFADFFRNINYEWLEEYFEVEPYDRIILSNPEKQVLNLGGHILFALRGEEVIGTCALLKHTDFKYELAKMGVLKKHRGQGVGHRLAEAGIERARSLGAKRLILGTSKVLTAANRLYASLGFTQANMAEIGPLPYKRETIVMGLDL